MSRSSSDAPASRLVAALERVAAFHAARTADPGAGGLQVAIVRWQARRLRRTYADLEAQQRYAAAIRFFETDLYGGADFTRRDADLARVVPVMKRLLPNAVIGTVATAVELNALSMDLDAALGREFADAESGVRDTFTVAQYCAAYRSAGRYDDRLRQIGMAGDVGLTLDRYVHKPMLRAALGLMHKPAHVAGLGALQDFLERGFEAFADMDGAVEFLATLETRERAIHDSIVTGSNAPFGDPESASP